MGNLYKMQAHWTGFQGAPGVNTFYTDDDPPNVEEFFHFYTALTTAIANPVSIVLDLGGVSVDAATGALTGGWSTTADATVEGSGSGDYILGTGVCIRWETGVITAGRRVRGHTFIVPTNAGIFGSNGLLSDGAYAVFAAAAADLIEALDGHLQVWHRPVNGAGGSAEQVQSAFIPRTPTVLRSRQR